MSQVQKNRQEVKWVIKAINCITLSVLGLIVAAFVFAWIYGSYFEHPLSPGAIKDLLGRDQVELSLERRIDFIGISTHGELFDYHKYSLDEETVNQFVRSGRFAHYPLFEDSLYISPRQAGPVNFSRWKQTPLITQEDQTYMRILVFGNLNEYASSREFIKADYLTKPGNYYAYFSTYPIGNYLYVLVPGENTLYLVRKRG